MGERDRNADRPRAAYAAKSVHDEGMRIDVGFKTMLLACLAVGLCWALIHLFPVLLVIVVALVIAGMLSPSITWLEGRRMRRGWAIAAVFFGLFVVTAALLAITVPSLIKELSASSSGSPSYRRRSPISSPSTS